MEYIARLIGIIVFFLTLSFVVLKLAALGQIQFWSWWWVFSPVLIAIGVWLSLVMAIIIKAIIKVSGKILFQKILEKYKASESKNPVITKLDLKIK